ncbi:hypothetical protein DL766_007696 [Monosporascus sp. MC13-8B]|uniref:Extracellular membrane protein CFEM domain-containing protein n=1 Tax=Monosporascus cannonballus TaxID=155416 RepID=A0ABY0H3T1_9PEZI|nr:hypothetical protein DL763_010764 [Monosporascus cannonballus]RYO81049.1 hypothetical protein DL762_007352 [Monosporascus cannonballus]RYP22595.1 hypothetical protein DL766_007696 [Monosporascus sp. MC13-8B]
MSKYLISGLALAGHGLAFSNQHIPRPTPPPKFILPAQIKAAPAPTEAASAKGDQPGGGGAGGAAAEVCKTANSLVAYCASAIPEIEFASSEEIAACLCCDGEKFEPEYFDDSAMSCANFISSAAPSSSSEYSAWSTLGNFCGGGGLEGACSKGTATKATKTTGSAAGPVTSKAEAKTKTAATPAPGAEEEDDDCDFLATIGNYCALETRGFERLPLSSQAECLCYMTDRSTTTWVPDVFDGAFSSCSDHASTAWTNFRPSRLSAYEDLCSSVGDILVASADATTTAADGLSAADAEPTGTAAAGGEGSSETASGSATAVTVTVTPSSTAEPDTAAAGGLGLPAVWPVAIGAVLGAVVLVL